MISGFVACETTQSLLENGGSELLLDSGPILATEVSCWLCPCEELETDLVLS